MKTQQVSSNRTVATTMIIAGASALTIMALVVPAALVASSREAAATPQYAAQTGRACGQCHVNPAGSGPLKPAGAKFKANGYK